MMSQKNQTFQAVISITTQMEKYSKHLERLVSERTEELEDEKERATSLLYSESITIAGNFPVSVLLAVCRNDTPGSC